MQDKNVNFKQGKEKREQLSLPPLYFVATDQWIDVIGEKAFLAWLKMFTWCDRTNLSEDNTLWDEAVIPSSLTKVMKRLGVGRGTFYNQIIKPLWNVGLIDIEEYEDSKQKGQKAMNITVYKYPQNKKALSFAPLEVVRDYDKDYTSTAKTFAKKGGRPKKDSKPKQLEMSDIDIVEDNNEELSYPQPKVYSSYEESLFAMEYNSIDSEPCSEIEQGGVLDENRGCSISEQGVFSDKTGGCSEIEHNNSINSITNSFNGLNNSFNELDNNFNSSSSNIDKLSKEEEEEVTNMLITFGHELSTSGIMRTNKQINDTISLMIENGILFFDYVDIQNAINHYKKECSKRGGISMPHQFFVTGFEMKLNERHSISVGYKEKRVKEVAKAKSYQYAVEGNSFPFYNWLEG